MRFAILGPLEVSSDGTDLTPRAAKPRSLLVRLLVDANHVVPAEQLAEDLWDGQPPPSAAATIQGYVSQIRKAVGADRLLTRAGGYELVVGPGELDRDAFAAEVEASRSALATEAVASVPSRIRTALSMWRGDALADATGAAWAAPEIARLDELRASAMETGVDAQLSLGAYGEAVAAAESATGAYPLREHLWAQLMTALYHEGRQADALRAFQRVRALLADELGIDPSRELVELEARIVRQEIETTRTRDGGGHTASMSAPTSETLSFLFTDLVSSTRLWEEHTEAMSGALADHDALLRESVERHGGSVVKSTGDGTVAVFSQPEAAVRAATDAQQSLDGRDWGSPGRLHIRMAVHTGVAELRDGDYFGPALNRASRLLGIAHGGQVLISQATEAIVRDSSGMELIDLGEHRLRDLSRPERVYQLVVPGLRHDFPPLRSLDALPTNLPVQLTSFIGRGPELERLRGLISEHRVVTVTGVGGVGKTRLALHAAADLVGEYADGAWYCELAAATDDETMLGIVAAALNVPARSGMELDESIVEFFRHKELLLVLDNCEHLLDPAARLVDRILRGSPRIRVVATSREALDVDGESVMPLRSMGVAASDALVDVNDSDAVQLFVDRATSARGDFALDASNAATVNTICRRLDGIPLAIELAAVRVVSMSPADIASLLDERFRLLTGGRRVALERHQTLRATVEWSYGLLESHERIVFDRVSVFAGTFDASAARGVVTDEAVAEWDVIDALDGLVRKSLVIAETHLDGTTRYQLLETLRQYARDRLDEGGETDRFRERHAAYFAEFAEQVRVGLLGPDEFAWRLRREPELDNIRIAIAWAIDREDPALIAPYIDGAMDEAHVLWSKMGRPATRAVPFADRFEPTTRVSLLMLAALEAYMLGDMPTSVALGNEAEELSKAVDVALLPGLLRIAFMNAYPENGLLADGYLLSVETPEWIERSGLSLADQSRIYTALGQYGLQVKRDFETARRLTDRGVELALLSRNPSTISLAYFTNGMVLLPTDPDRALACFEHSIALHEQGPLLQLGGALYTSALVFAQRGDERVALERLHRGIEFLYERGRNPELDGAFGFSIEILAMLGHGEIAAVILGSVFDGVLRLLRDMPLPPGRSAPDVRALRDAIGRERFNALVARGAAMSYDELVEWTLRSLNDLERTLNA